MTLPIYNRFHPLPLANSFKALPPTIEAGFLFTTDTVVFYNAYHWLFTGLLCSYHRRLSLRFTFTTFHSALVRPGAHKQHMMMKTVGGGTILFYGNRCTQMSTQTTLDDVSLLFKWQANNKREVHEEAATSKVQCKHQQQGRSATNALLQLMHYYPLDYIEPDDEELETKAEIERENKKDLLQYSTNLLLIILISCQPPPAIMNYHCSHHLLHLFTYLLFTILSIYLHLQPSNAAQVEASRPPHNLRSHHHHELGSFCNPVEGCLRPSLTCHKNRCECAPGYGRKMEEEECTRVVCQRHEDCNLQLDPGRLCHQGACSHCKNGLQLDPVVNRCISRLGYACNSTWDCLPDGTILPANNEKKSKVSFIDDASASHPICRSGRCVCTANEYPNGDWSACQRRLQGCSSHRECNPFGDDPYRYCSTSRQECLCKLGYYEEAAAGGLCLPYVPLQFSLMMPFWLTLIMLTICILVYVSRRLATSGRAAAAAAAVVAENGGSIGNSSAVAVTAATNPEVDALNRPPPSYETVVKTTTTTTSLTTPSAN